MKFKTGQILIILSLSLLFLAYSNFGPTALTNERIVGYVKNHFVREIIFGLALTIWTIKLTLLPKDKLPFNQVAILGSVVVFPFWIAFLFGWSDQGLAEIWGKAIDSNTAYILHTSQVVLFLIGLLLIKFAQKDSNIQS